MKRLLCILFLIPLLVGCSGENKAVDRALALRTKLLSGSVEFDTKITADYGDKAYIFETHCAVDAQGVLKFTVTKPESISGISGYVSSTGAEITFEDKVLAFGMLADEQLTPVSGPWILINTLRSGYLTSGAIEADHVRLSIDDSYRDNALHLDIWLDGGDIPVRGEILWQGRRILSLDVSNFQFV